MLLLVVLWHRLRLQLWFSLVNLFGAVFGIALALALMIMLKHWFELALVVNAPVKTTNVVFGVALRVVSRDGVKDVGVNIDSITIVAASRVRVKG